MARTKKDILSFLDKESFKKARKIDNNTFQYFNSNNEKVIRLHDTDIIVFNNDGSITLNSGGWQTVTTKDRMNKFTSLNIYQEKSIWYVIDNGNTVPYKDGITFHVNGTVTGQGENPKRKLALKKRIQKYSKDYVKALFNREIDKPDNGDCFYCQFDSMSGIEHFKTHMQEKYYVPSLLMNAIRTIPVSKIAEHCIGYYMNYHSQECNGFKDIAREQIEKSIKRYLYQNMELAR